MGSAAHKQGRWLRLELLRFMVVECGEAKLLPVTFEMLSRLWGVLPPEVCCKWVRVLADSGEALTPEVADRVFIELVCGVDLPRLGKQGFNCFEALFGEINSLPTPPDFPQGRMQIKGRQVVHMGIKVSGRNLVRRRVSWFCCSSLDDNASRN